MNLDNRKDSYDVNLIDIPLCHTYESILFVKTMPNGSITVSDRKEQIGTL